MPVAQPGWFAVFTRPRQERIAHEHLGRQGFESFLPLAANPYQRRSKPGQQRVEPLFPRYLFLHAIPEQQNLAPVRSTRGVVGMVRFGMRLVPVPDWIVRGLHQRRDASTGLIAIDPVPCRSGDRVRVFDGPLSGLEGVLSEYRGERRAALLLSLLGRETSVEVDALLLQRAG